MEISKQRAERYKEIKDEAFRNYLISFDEFLDHKIGEDLVPLDKFVQYPYPEKLHLRAKVVSRMVTYCTNSGVMNSIKARNSAGALRINTFDKQSCLAFSSIARVIALRYANGDETNVDVKERWTDFPWKEVIDDTKTILGKHPLSDLIRIPNPQPKLNQYNSVDVTTPPKQNVEEKPTGILSKLLIVEQNQFSLELISMDELQELLDELPRGSIDTISFSRYNPDPAFLKTVMAIAAFRNRKLNDFDPETDEYTINAYRNALIVSWTYLRDLSRREGNNITNLWQLYEAVKAAASKSTQEKSKQ